MWWWEATKQMCAFKAARRVACKPPPAEKKEGYPAWVAATGEDDDGL